MCIHTRRQTDRQTDGRTDGQMDGLTDRQIVKFASHITNENTVYKNTGYTATHHILKLLECLYYIGAHSDLRISTAA